MDQIVKAQDTLSPKTNPVLPLVACTTENCETRVHIGVFFDGTGNNRYLDEPIKRDSNVARLFRAYPDRPLEGYLRTYLPGVGTVFPEIGEVEARSTGMGFGGGGEGRIIYGLLSVFDAIHQSFNDGRSLLSQNAFMALCRNGRRGSHVDPETGVENDADLPIGDEKALKTVGMDDIGGLLSSGSSDGKRRQQFLRQQSADLAQLIKDKPKPKIVEIFVDVFGFSRGAAQARVFCTWLNEIFQGDQLCAVPAQIRFLGIFDTVSSVGIPTSAGFGQNGHLAWATPEHLHVPARVKNCLHLVAMHENRGSFPLDQVLKDGGLPANCTEFCCPGMHSDIGGGYTPGTQGRDWKDGRGDDASKVSQMPLISMYNAATAALVPLDKTITRTASYDPFEVSPAIEQAYTQFIDKMPKDPQPLRNRLCEYLAWRYQMRDSYTQLPSVAQASRIRNQDATTSDYEDLLGANRVLQMDVKAVAAYNGTTASGWDYFLPTRHTTASIDVRRLAPEAPELLKRISEMPATPPELANLFANYVHDSYAGFRPYDKATLFGWDFIPGSWEPEGYLRYRRRYEGSNQQFTMLQPNFDHANPSENVEA